jgi:HEAT repeat protein
MEAIMSFWQKLKQTSYINGLVKALKGEEFYSRREAAEALGETRDVRAVKPLTQALRDENRLVRVSAAEALGKIGDAQAIDPLIQALRDDDPEVRDHTAEALIKIGPPAIDPLIRALGERGKRTKVVQRLSHSSKPLEMEIRVRAVQRCRSSRR